MKFLDHYEVLREDIYWKETLHQRHLCCGDEITRHLYFNLFSRLVLFCEFQPHIGVWCASEGLLALSVDRDYASTSQFQE